MPKIFETIKCTGDLAPAVAMATETTSTVATATTMTKNACSNNIIVRFGFVETCAMLLNSISMCENDWQNSRRKMETETGSRKICSASFEWLGSFIRLVGGFHSLRLVYCANKVWRLYENICSSYHSLSLSITLRHFLTLAYFISLSKCRLSKPANRTTRSYSWLTANYVVWICSSDSTKFILTDANTVHANIWL